MVSAVRRGEARRSVARRYGVSLSTVQWWEGRAGTRRLDRVDFSDRPRGPRQARNRTPRELEDTILQLRRELREDSDLGEYGAAAIRRELVRRGVVHPPCECTIHRVLDRRGALDGRRRAGRKPPPRGWYLPLVAGGEAELDAFDLVEGLVIQNGPQVVAYNVVSLHGGLVGAYPHTQMRAHIARDVLAQHWRDVGLPGYAQFDNGTVFHGPHHYADAIGSVTRMCLSLGVTPAFVPPQETGFQAAIEGFNGLWQSKVWSRFHHDSLEGLQQRSTRYVVAHRQRTAKRQEAAPERRPLPQEWELDLEARPHGTIIFLRRTTDHGCVSVLGHSFPVDPTWTHRLVRCQVELDDDVIRFYALRRREPDKQPLLNEIPYRLPGPDSHG